MKLLVGQDAGSYTFSAAAKTITVTGLGLLSLENFLLVTNVTDNIVIYKFTDPTLGGVLSGPAGTQVLTLTFDTTGMSDTDDLQIWVIDPLVSNRVQSSDSGNNAVRTSANGVTQFVGTFAKTREFGIVRQLVILAALDSVGNPNNSTIGGTFVFEYSDDGITATISETRIIASFETVRDFDLLNAGEYFRVKFTPSRSPVLSEAIIISTTHRRINDGSFVRLADQQIERRNAAMPQTFAYLKGFGADGISKNVTVDRRSNLKVKSAADETTFGEQVIAARANRIDVQFHVGNPETITKVLSDTGSGSSTRTNGVGVITSGTDVTMEYCIESKQSIKYSSAREIYLFQTLQWSVPPTGTNDLAMAGLFSYTSNEGYRIGYKGTSFGIQYVKDAVEISFTPKASFSLDDLTGSINSLFTRAGTPEAIDLTKMNVFRIRFGWLSAAPTTFEIQSPDGEWVVFHEIKHPNINDGAQIINPNKSAHLIIKKVASDATNITMKTGCWGGGITVDTQSVQQPDGDYVNLKADGQAADVDGNPVVSVTPLNAGITYTSGWIDTDGWGSAEIYIATDQVSASNGLKIEYTRDANATTPVAEINPSSFTYTAANAAAGSNKFTIDTALDGFRIKYTNGGVNQTTFTLVCSLRVDSKSPQGSIEEAVNETQQAVRTRGLILASNGTTYGNIGRGSSGGLDVGIVQHEVETPMKSLGGLKITRTSITTVSTKIVATPQTNRRSIGIKAICSGSALIYLGTSSAVSSGTGHPLSDGQSVDIELDETVTEIWAIASTGTQATSAIEVGL